MIRVSVENLSITNVGFVVLMLKSQVDDRTLPIYIGTSEAQAILLKLNAVELPRPMTHDLLKSLLERLEASLERVEIHDYRSGTFFARLQIKVHGETVTIDARPSDAVALALRTDAPVFVSPAVMDEAGVVLDAEGKVAASDDETARDEVPKSERDLLDEQLAQAVAEERYEDAARIRDKMNEPRSHN